MTYKDIIILHEDNHLLVVLKPANVPVQEDITRDPDMVNMLKEYRKEHENKPGEAFIGLVHRLDRPTGGVMVFAKTSKAADSLTKDMRKGDFEKRYLAVVEGVPREKSAKLRNYLKKSDDNHVRIVPELSEGAKYAELDYKLLAVSRDGKRSLLQVDLMTGRSHQIRVQLAGIGNPIVGDVKYGRPDGRQNGFTTNLGLWALQLTLIHPTAKRTMVFQAYPPESAPWTDFDINSLLTLNIRNSYRQKRAYNVSLSDIGNLELELAEDAPYDDDDGDK